MTTSRPRRTPCTTSFWRRTLDTARSTGGWTRVERFYTRNTAQQVASDLTRAHLRDPRHRRVTGILDGEVWEARWRPALDGPAGDYRIEIRLVEAAQSSPTVSPLPAPFTESTPGYTEKVARRQPHRHDAA